MLASGVRMTQDGRDRPEERPEEVEFETGPKPRVKRPFPATWYGALVIAIVGLLAWLVLAQGVPGVMAVVVVAATQGADALKAGSVESTLVPYVPAIIAAGALISVCLVLLARPIGWLPPLPAASATPAVRVLWTLLATVACIGGSMLIAMLLDMLGQEATEQPILVEASKTTGLAFVLAVVLLGPIGEEFMFRRFTFSVLDRGLGRFAAFAGSALLFALVHFNPSAFFLYAWMGLCFAFAYERTGSVLGSIAVHVANNAWVVLLTR